MSGLDPASLNRARLFEALGAALRRSERTGRSAGLLAVSVTVLPVDAPGAVPTEPGAGVTEQVIAAAGRILKAKLKETDTLGRYGSNLFAILIDDCDPASLRETAGRLIALVEATPLSTSAGPMAATVSAGGIVFPLHAQTVGAAIQGALEALALAQQQPPGAFVASTPEPAAARALRREEAVSRAVMEAMDDGRLLLMLQPVVRARDRSLAFYEGLLRLCRQDGVTIPASDFIEDAEKLGLVRPVDRRALALGLALLAENRGLTLAVNMSSLTVGDEDWIAAVQSSARDRPDIPARLIVEVTETAVIHDFDAAAAFFDRLRSLGCRIAIDDFGAGYTSFRHLRRLTVDMLKIDGGLIANLSRDRQASVLVAAMIEMASGLGLETVAEWVSDEENAALLAATGVTYLQGFLFGHPAPVEALKDVEALKEKGAL